MGRPATVEGLRKHYEICGDGLIEQSWITYNMSPTDHIPTRIMTASVEGVDVGHVEIQSMQVNADIEEKGMTNKMYELYGHSRPMVYVKFFYVLPQYRSHGIGKRILEEIFKMTKEKGMDLVVLYVVPEND